MIETKSSIVLKARNLFLRYGIKSVTMDDIARELGISKKTLYQFFENKADLLTSISEHNEAKDKEVMHHIVSGAKDALDEMLGIARYVTEELSSLLSPTALFDLQKYYPDIWAKFVQFQQEFIYQHIRQNIERGMKEGIYREGLDADIVAKLYVSKTDCLLDEDMFPSKKYDKVKLFKQYFSYHIHGIANAKGLKLLEKKFSEP
jgi:TetR/AcrR family transcriptional regulator, cholesterol catabolism regulator